MGLIRDLTPFAEDILPMLARDVKAEAPKDSNAHAKAVADLSSKLVNDPTARAKLAGILATAKAAPTPTALAQRAQSSSSSSSSGGGLMGLIGQLAPFAEDILPMLA
jgi:hypothetical protein